MCDKRELRRYWGSLRNEIPAGIRRDKSAKIADKILSDSMVAESEIIFSYVSCKSEPCTHLLIKELLFMGKRIAVPLCDLNSHTMQAVEIHDFGGLTRGAYGILEPPADNKSLIQKSEIQLILVPALAFDREGYRLGYGGGFYDRYLEDFGGRSIGLAFSECIADSLPHMEHDKPVDFVLTDN